MSPPLMTLLLLIAALATAAIVLFQHSLTRAMIVGYYKPLMLLLVLAACLRYPIGAPFYHGMEYEDCFVHQAVARQIFDPTNPINHHPTFRQSVLSVGSLDDAHEHETFLHFIGYPTAIRAVQILFGDTAAAGHWVSLVASLLNVLLVACLAAQCGCSRILALAAAAIYTCVPLSVAFSATTSAEVLSSSFVVLFLVLVGLCARPSPGRAAFVISYAALSFSIIVAILVKRENMLLVLSLPVMFLLSAPTVSSSFSSRVGRSLKRSAVALAFPIFFLLVCLDLPTVYLDERAAAGSDLLSLSNLRILGPAFAWSLAHPRFYFLFGFFLLCLPLVWRRCYGLRSVMVLFLAYLCMYAAHWRSYYFLKWHTVSVWDTVRYMLNILPLLSMLSASGVVLLGESLCAKSRFLAKHQRVIFYPLAAVALVAASVIGLYTRAHETRIEQDERVGPIISVIDTVCKGRREDAWLLTFEPCIAQIYGPRWLRMVDLAIIDRLNATGLEDAFGSGPVFAFLRPWDTDEANEERMALQLAWLRQQEWKSLNKTRSGQLWQRVEAAP